MKRHLILGCCLAAFLTAGAYAQEGFTGPGAARVQAVSAAEAGSLADDARVVLTGRIVRSLGDEKYIFSDASGEITVEIDKKVWRGLSVGENDNVEISGKIDKDWGKVEIEVKKIRKV